MRILKATGKGIIAVVRWSDTNNGFITALATVVIAILTGIYVHYSRAQWKVMRDQLAEVRDTRLQSKADNANAIKAQQIIAQDSLAKSQANFEQGATASRESFRDDQRAWIGVSNEYITELSAQKFTAAIEFFNSGKLPHVGSGKPLTS